MKKILIKGAGIGGLLSGYFLSEKGYDVSILAPIDAPEGSASWFAGGMLAPYCEKANAEQIVEDLGVFALKWWQTYFKDLVTTNGTLVIAPPRDEVDLDHFAAKTHKHRWVNQAEIADLEPDLGDRFKKGLFFAEEAHLDPRALLYQLKQTLLKRGVTFLDLNLHKETSESLTKDYDYVLNTSGIAHLKEDKNLRGVRGEMLLLKCHDIHLSRSIRLLHPRIPLYIVPRKDNIFMIGATMIESEHDGCGSVRSVMELLNAAYTLHPAFAEAEILEIGTAVRPAYEDNFPRLQFKGKSIYLNGFYRHGYLLAPYMADKLCQELALFDR